MAGAKLKVEGFCVGPLQSNCYIVLDPASGQGILVDPGMDSEFVLSEAQKRDVVLTAIVCTHGHFDHAYLNGYFKEHLRCPLLAHEADAPLLASMGDHAALFGYEAQPSPPPDAFLKDGEAVPVGAGSLKVLHTPGHTQGGICLLGDGFLLSGDTLFAQSVGRTDLPGGSYEQLMGSIRNKLLVLPPATEVFPGHGPVTSIRHEKRHNPFLRGIEP